MEFRPITSFFKKWGGWLILIGLGVVTTPIFIFLDVRRYYAAIEQGLCWGYIGHNNSELANFLWRIFIYSDLTVNVVLIFVYVYLVELFFLSKKSFPKLLILVTLFEFGWGVFVGISRKLGIPYQPFYYDEILIYGVTGFVVVWYMLVSKRVRATFVS